MPVEPMLLYIEKKDKIDSIQCFLHNSKNTGSIVSF